MYFIATCFGGFSSPFQTTSAPYQFTRTALLPSSFSSSSNNAELGVTIHFGRCLFAARAAGAAETAGPKPADLWTGDWLTVCDNTGSCRTAGYNADGAERLITLSFYREAGAQAKVAGLWFAIYRGSDEPLPEGGSLRIDGKPLTRNEILTPQEIAALLEALKRGSSITWAAEGGPVWQLSSNGALAALRFMDDYQQRSGTPSALIDKGRSRRPNIQLKKKMLEMDIQVLLHKLQILNLM